MTHGGDVGNGAFSEEELAVLDDRGQRTAVALFDISQRHLGEF